MSQTLEDRVEQLEKNLFELATKVGKGGRGDWVKTIGSLDDDELSREADRLGREYRRKLDSAS